MSMKEKIFSRKISILGKEISAIFIAFAVMGVLGAAVVASYGTSTATVTVTQGVSFSPSEDTAAITIPSDSIKLNDITISNAGSISANVKLTGVVAFQNGTAVTDGSVTLSYSDGTNSGNPLTTTVPTTGLTITPTLTVAQNAEVGRYVVTTDVAPVVL